MGKKIWDESLKYRSCYKKTWIKNELKEPETQKSSGTSSDQKSGFTQKKTKKIKRRFHVAFMLTEQEKYQLKQNVKKFGFSTMSKYIRNRCFRQDITKSEIIQILDSFITQKLTEVALSPDSKLQWRKKKIKEQFTLNPILIGLDRTQKEKFKNSMKELADTYSNEIQEELNSILLLQKIKLERAEAC